MIMLLFTDHPRGCGENLSVLLLMIANLGSPPRMRGKPISPLTQSSMSRITPADAGKTSQNLQERIQPMDHPRGCGENYHFVLLSFIQQRITPADAGKTPQLPPVYLSAWDHPRGCGENSSAQSLSVVFRGSPPRMRGKQRQRPFEFFQIGITPADAGKTLLMLRCVLG